MFNELVFLENAPDSNSPYLGGSPHLPKESPNKFSNVLKYA